MTLLDMDSGGQDVDQPVAGAHPCTFRLYANRGGQGVPCEFQSCKACNHTRHLLPVVGPVAASSVHKSFRVVLTLMCFLFICILFI